jgi:hypothetical protein
MADRVIQPDSGNTLVLSNDDASAKIEVKDNGTNEITGKVSIGTSSPYASSTLTAVGNQSCVALGRGGGSDPTFTFSADAGSMYLSDDGNVSYNMIWKNDGDIYSYAWTEWGASSTVVGFSSLSSKLLAFKRIGKMVWFWFYFYGASNATNFTFTLPYAAKNANPQPRGAMNWVYNNGATAFALGDHWTLPIDSTVVSCLKSDSATGWTNTNNKGAIGSGFYEIESI